MSSKVDFNMIIWGMLISLITIGTMVILGVSSNDSTDMALKLIIAVIVSLAIIFSIKLGKRLIRK